MLEMKNVLVTGVSSGIGCATADKLIEMENEIMKELNDKQKDLFWKYMECEDKRTCAEIDYALNYGFTYAVTLIKELLGAKF